MSLFVVTPADLTWCLDDAGLFCEDEIDTNIDQPWLFCVFSGPNVQIQFYRQQSVVLILPL